MKTIKYLRLISWAWIAFVAIPCVAQNPDECLIGTINDSYYDLMSDRHLQSDVANPDTIFGQYYVDLGLPSGLLWAQYNVGANGVGEGHIGKVFNYDYLRGKDIGQLDAELRLNDVGLLALEYDGAFMQWDYPWHLPTLTDFQELVENTTARAAKRGDQYGYVFTSSRNGKELFLPAPHRKTPDGGLTFTALYMSSTPYNGDVADGEWSGLYILYQRPENAVRGDARMDYWISLEDGVLIRPVFKPSEVYADTSIGEDGPEEKVTGERYTEIRIVDEEPVEEERVFVIAEEQPQFPGGQPALHKWIADHIIYPTGARKNNIDGRVTVQFVVTKHGDIGQVKIVRSKHPELDAEAIRVVKSLPRFTPAMQDGVAVNCWYTVPVLFKLPASE